MPRLVRPPAPRAPAPRRERRTPPPPEGEGVALRLAIGRDGVGLELARPVKVGPLLVQDLAASLPGVKFPVDVSGGVPRFRHRRGEMQRLEIEIGARALERFAAPRLRGIVGTRAPDLWVGVARNVVSVCLTSAPDPDDETPSESPVLAFQVHALVEERDLLLVVTQARGHALPAPAIALAIASVEAVLAASPGLAERRGALFVVHEGATALGRALLPEAGARAPGASEMRWSALAANGDAWLLSSVQGAIAAAPDDTAVRAREGATLLEDADDAVVLGDLERGRASCLDALERAPRHPEVLRRIADLDVRAGGRAEAALAMLAEAREDPGARLGTVPGELLAEMGDADAAMASLERAAETDDAPALAARSYEIAARLGRDALEAARWLDRAIALAPRSTSARWARIERRLALGRLEDALADVEHLEAIAKGTRARHRVWMLAGRRWREAGLGAHAGALFERALRFVPDDPSALAGLGTALIQEGREARGVALLERALGIAEERRLPSAPFGLALARALAESLDDVPSAIARAAAIPADAPEAPTARGLEGRLRARLGDLTGATLAFARLRELASSLPSPSPDDAGRAAAKLLAEAAEIELDRMHDPLAAQRHLAAALRLTPRDAELLRAYRDVGAAIAGVDASDDDTAFDAAEAPSATHRTVTERPMLDLSIAPPEENEELVARVEELTRRLQGAPDDDAIAAELIDALQALGRGHELLALVMARLEDASPARKLELAPRARRALSDLADAAAAAGRHDEAALYRTVLETLPAP